MNQEVTHIPTNDENPQTDQPAIDIQQAELIPMTDLREIAIEEERMALKKAAEDEQIKESLIHRNRRPGARLGNAALGAFDGLMATGLVENLVMPAGDMRGIRDLFTTYLLYRFGKGAVVRARAAITGHGDPEVSLLRKGLDNERKEFIERHRRRDLYDKPREDLREADDEPDSQLDRTRKRIGRAADIAKRGSYEVEMDDLKESTMRAIDSLRINPSEPYAATLLEEMPEDRHKSLGQDWDDQPREINVTFNPKTNVLDIKDCIRHGWWYNGGAEIVHSSFELAFDWEGKVTDIKGTVYDKEEDWSTHETIEKPEAFSEIGGFIEKELWEGTIEELNKVAEGVKSGHTEVKRAALAA